MPNFPTTAIELDANSRPGVAAHQPGTVGPVNLQVTGATADANGVTSGLLATQATLSTSNTGLPSTLPAIVQKAAAASTGSVASLAKAFANNNVAGNSIIVVCGVGNNTAPTVADSAGNTYTQAAISAYSTTFETAIFYAVGIASGANTVTVTNAGATASVALEIYEVSGLIAQVQAQPDQTATANGSSGTAATVAIGALSPNELAFAGVGVGTAAQTITAGSGWTNDSGQQNPTTPAGLYSFVSLSQFLGSLKYVTPQATFTSEPWAIAVATFRPVVLGVEGTVNVAAAAAGGATYYHLVSGASTNATVVKAAPGTLYQVTLNCNTSAAARYLKFYDSATTPTAGSGTIVYVVQAPLLAASTGSTTVVNFPMGLAFTTGIAFVTVTTLADTGSTGVSAGDLSIDLAYK